ncbi:hypothetical protein D3C80_2043430 [compost metagenome]
MAPISMLSGRRGKPMVNTQPATSKYPSQLVIRPRLRILVMVGTSRPNLEYRRNRMATPPTQELRLRLKA